MNTKEKRQEERKHKNSHYVHTIDKFTHDLAMAALQGRLAANPTITSKEAAKLAAQDVKYFLEELTLNYKDVDFQDENQQ